MKKTKLIPLYAANGLVYGLNALYYCFIQLYISAHHPDDVTGVLLAIGPFVAIFAPVFWGMLADRAKSKNLILAISVVGSAVFYFLLGLSADFLYLAVMLVLTMFFMSPFGGLIDIITLEHTSKTGDSYGPIRISGTFVFGLLPMVLTPFTDSNIKLIFPVYLVMATLAAVSVMLSPRVEGHGSREKRPSVLPLFKDVSLMLIFLFVGVSQFTWAYYLNYFPTHLTVNLGLPQSVWGVNSFITAIAEVPFFLLFTPLFDKLGIKKLLGISLILCSLRYLGLALLTNVPLLLAIGLITGAATTIFTYCGSVYITRHVTPESKASANSLMYALGNGIPKVLAGLLGGIMTLNLGFVTSSLICTSMCTLSLIIFFASHKNFTHS